MKRIQLLVICFACVFATGCYGTAYLKMHKKGDALSGRIHYVNVHSLYMISMWDNSNEQFIWVVQARGKCKARKFQYGITPKRMEQIYPWNNARLRALKPGDTFVVAITYTHDHLAGPTSHTKNYLFHVQENGRLQYLKDGVINFPDTIYPDPEVQR